MNFLHNIPLFTIVMSFLTSVVCSIVSAKWAKRIYAVIGMIVIGLTTYLMVHTLIMGESFVYMMGHFPAPWGNEIKVGPLESSLAAIFCLILYLCVYGGFLKLKDDIRESKRNLYFSLVNLVQVSILALLYTNDIFTAYVFIEISTLASCGLLMIRQIGRTTAAATRYMIFSLLGSGLFLIGIILLYNITGHLLIPNIKEQLSLITETSRYMVPLIVATALITVGLAIKSGCFPFHFWMPDTYGTATPSSSAILSGLISKAYILVLIKVIYRVIGFEVFSKTGITDVLFIFGVIGMIVGSLSAIKENNINRMIAFSSAAQIGYIYMGLGLGTTEGTVAAIFHIVTHALTKPLLFLAADRLEAVSGNSKKFANLTGAAHRNRLAGLAFTAGSLSMIGIPGFMGFMSKLQFATSAMAVPGKLVLTMAALAISTLLNTLYFFRTVMRIYTPALDSPYFGHRVHAKQQRTFVVAAICFMVLNLLFGLQSQPVIDLLTKGLSLFH